MRKLLTLVLATAALVVVVLYVNRGDGTDARTAVDAPGSSTDTAEATGAAPQAPVSKRPEVPVPAEESETAEVAEPVTTEQTATRASVLEASSQWVHGRILYPTGTPDDEKLYVLALDRRRTAAGLYGERAISDGAWDPTVEREPLVASSEVQPDGTFRIGLPEEHETAYLALSGRYLYSNETTEIELPVAPAPAPGVTLTGELGAWMNGSLLAPRGASEAQQNLLLANLELGPDLSAGFDTARLQGVGHTMYATAAADGTFEFRAVPCALTHGVLIRHNALATTLQLGLESEPGQRQKISIQLLHGGSIAGRVIGEDGLAVSGAEVGAWRPGRLGEVIEALWETRSDADGQFLLSNVTPGEIELKANHEDYRRTSLRLEKDLFDGDTLSGFELLLGQGKTISGRVLFESGDPAVTADVRVAPDFSNLGPGGFSGPDFDPRDGGSTETDEQGAFTVAGLGAAAFRVIATLSVAEGERSGAWRAEAKNVRGGDPPLELVLERLSDLAGRVQNSKGEPVTDFTVRAMLVGSGGMMGIGAERRSWSFDEEEGRFEATGLGRGEWELVVEADGYATSEKQTALLPAEGEPGPLLFVVPFAASVSGIVLDTGGAPVAGAQVALDLNLVQLVEAQQRGGGPSVRSDIEGRFLLENLDPGPISLKASHDGFAASEPVACQVFEGEREEDLVLSLRLGGTLTGEVLGHDGDPAAGRMIVVQRMPATGQQQMATSDARGEFRIEHLEPGNWQVIAMRNVLTGELDLASEEEGEGMAGLLGDMEMDVVDIVDGGETHVVLGKPADDPILVSGQVTHAGEGVGGAVISFLPDAAGGLSDMEMVVAGQDGSFELELEHRGETLVTVQHMLEMGQQNSIEYREEIPAEGDRMRLDLELPGGSISGRVLGPDGGYLENCRITMNVEDGIAYGSLLGGQYVEMTTGEDGRYEVSYVRPGTYAISAGGASLGGMLGDDAVGGRVVRSGIRIVDEESVDDVDFQLETPGGLTGVVRGGAGSPILDASIFVRDEDGSPLERFSFITTDGAGLFSYSGLAPGRYMISARKGGEVSPEVGPVTILAGETATADVTLEPGTLLLITVVDKEEKQIRARVRVVDERGADVSGMVSLNDIMGALGSGFSNQEQRIGPLPPGTYQVTAVLDDGRKAKRSVKLTGKPERSLKLRAR